MASDQYLQKTKKPFLTCLFGLPVADLVSSTEVCHRPFKHLLPAGLRYVQLDGLLDRQRVSSESSESLPPVIARWITHLNYNRTTARARCKAQHDHQASWQGWLRAFNETRDGLDDVVCWIKECTGKSRVEHTTGTLTTFIGQPFLPHPENADRYVGHRQTAGPSGSDFRIAPCSPPSARSTPRVHGLCTQPDNQIVHFNISASPSVPPHSTAARKMPSVAGMIDSFGGHHIHMKETLLPYTRVFCHCRPFDAPCRPARGVQFSLEVISTTRFELALECGNLDAAMETAKTIDRPQCWDRLVQQIVEKAYQQTKNFDKLSFLCLATGSIDKLSKMQKIADARDDPMSRFHNALYTDELAQEILDPPPIVTATIEPNWLAVSTGKNFFDWTLANGSLETGVEPMYVNGDTAAAKDDLDPEEGGWELDADAGEYHGAEPVDEVEEGGGEEDELPGSMPGVSEIEHWARNSPLATDHVAASSFKTAMQLLNRQLGVQ
ncbi:coatomer WD associated region-domain-containing protein [Mycena sp. CBHHK59/15]|nr:coatomer WD associated region-domain-containing protein [Mycena sp. CBHHK59/15]